MVPGLRSLVQDGSKPASFYLYALGAAFLGVSALFGGLGFVMVVLSLTQSFREELGS